MVEFHPLSCNQELILAYGAEFGLGTSNWNQQIVFDLVDLDERHVYEALRSISARHEILRTHIGRRAGRHCQAVDSSTAPIPHRVCRDNLETVARTDISTPFDLFGGPLWRSATVPRRDGGGALILTINHLVSDRQSELMLATEFMERYEEAGTRTVDDPFTHQYSEFARWQRVQVAHFLRDPNSVRCWSEYENTVRSMRTPWPTDDGAPTTVSGIVVPARAECTLTLSMADSDRLAAVARIHRTTVNSVFTAALSTAMARLPELRVGLVLGERSIRYPHRFSDTLGPFPDPWPISNAEEASLTFSDALTTVRDRSIQAIDTPLPFHLLLSRVPWLSREFRDPSGRTMVFYQFFADNSFSTDRYTRTAGVEMSDTFGEHSDIFGLHFMMGIRQASLQGALAYTTDRVTREDISALVAEIENVLAEACGSPVRIALTDRK